MYPSTAPETSSNRFTLIHNSQLESPINVDFASDHITKTTRTIPIMGEASSSSPDTNPCGQISPALARNTSLPSFVQSKASPSKVAISRERHSKLVKRAPKRSRTISQGQIARLSLEGSSNGAPLPSPSTSKTPASPSRDARFKGVETFVQIPTPPAKMPMVTTHKRIVSTSRPRSIRRGSHSTYDVTPDVVMELSSPSPPFVTSIASDIEGNAELDLFPSTGPIVYTRRTLDDTTGIGHKVTAKHKRGMSFDFLSLKPFVSLPTSPTTPVHERKRRSLRKTPHMSETGVSLEKWAEPVNERQRVLNVKRARKMAQVFGSEPPSTLYQITNLDQNVANDSDESVSPAENKIPISLDPLSSSISLISSRPASVSSSTNNQERDQTVDSHCVRPPTPPPFASSTNSDPRLMGSSLTFRLRRRRAAKLSQFFGVGYHDISESMPSTILPSPQPSPSRREPSASQLRPYDTDMPTPPTSIEVDVKMNGRTGLWSIVDGRRSTRDADMGDVINKLREMKAK